MKLIFEFYKHDNHFITKACIVQVGVTLTDIFCSSAEITAHCD